MYTFLRQEFFKFVKSSSERWEEMTRISHIFLSCPNDEFFEVGQMPNTSQGHCSASGSGVWFAHNRSLIFFDATNIKSKTEINRMTNFLVLA